MLKQCTLAVALTLAPLVALGQSFEEPARGSVTRADILSALRPHAEWDFGAPVEFVVGEMRVAGDVAFAMVGAQRPGGEQIDIFTAPVTLRGETDPQAGNGTTMEALMQKSGRMWVAVHIGINSSEGWWYDQQYCPIWAEVIPDACPE
ncbi:hypothetical protein [Aliiroseovarius subalbicans]|uniref:hypothetical protein n=1 Tax=Aliiroseovarius subalbicans TaxID=2925840 RepID=UPI001F563AE0|nr:hypothetical protein [Aliiroseovarius subalbicans]MCI2399208.1 hypothetical protein [Aliiroseovarius subalbicans]